MVTIGKNSPSPSKRPRASTRVNLRIAPGVKAQIQRAARMRQVKLTEFMITAAQAAAETALAERTHFALPPQKWREFNAALDAAPQEIPALRRLFTEPSVFKNE